MKGPVWEAWVHLEGLKLELGLTHVAGEKVEFTYNNDRDEDASQDDVMGTMNCDEAVTKFLNSHPCVAVDWIEPLVHLQRRLENQNIWTIMIMMLLNYYDEDTEWRDFDQNLNLQ